MHLCLYLVALCWLDSVTKSKIWSMSLKSHIHSPRIFSENAKIWTAWRSNLACAENMELCTLQDSSWTRILLTFNSTIICAISLSISCFHNSLSWLADSAKLYRVCKGPWVTDPFNGKQNQIKITSSLMLEWTIRYVYLSRWADAAAFMSHTVTENLSTF